MTVCWFDIVGDDSGVIGCEGCKVVETFGDLGEIEGSSSVVEGGSSVVFEGGCDDERESEIVVLCLSCRFFLRALRFLHFTSVSA